MLFVLPIVNPYGISRTQQNGIPSGCAIGKIENTRKQHPIGMHRNLRNLNYLSIRPYWIEIRTVKFLYTHCKETLHFYKSENRILLICIIL